MLPETPNTRREPGLWAGDQPRSAAGDGRPRILTFTLPMPHDTEDIGFDVVTIQRCAAGAKDAIEASATAQAIASLGRKEAECLAATLYASCTGDRYERLLSTTSARKDDAWKFWNTALDWVKRACTDTGDTQRVKDLHRDIIKAWPPARTDK